MPIGTRVALAYLALSGIAVGIWASAFPADFYRSFPGFGHAWVAVDGPYNEHLVRDAGAAYLMIAFLAAFALARPARAPAVPVGVGTLGFNLPHLAYHAGRLAMYAPLDRALNMVALGAAVAASLWLVVAPARR